LALHRSRQTKECHDTHDTTTEAPGDDPAAVGARMLNAEDNRLLTGVGPDTPMGRMLRGYWHPVLRSARLEADGAPVRVGLLGQKFVAFRVTHGEVGFVDEACPHRCTSLALARNEDNGLRCIFHGWKIDVTGRVVDVPTEPRACRAAFAESVPRPRYHVRESGGIVWVCLQQGQPPAFPDFEFHALPESQRETRIAVMHCNWVQAMESVLDSAHLGLLHQGQLQRAPADASMADHVRTVFGNTQQDTAPQLEVEPQGYGFREGALRQLPDGRRYVQIREFVAPYYSLLPAAPTVARRFIVASVPIDDEWTAQWFIHFSLDGPLTPELLAERWQHAPENPDNFYENPGDIGNLWGQDREAMRNGHFSGFPGRHIFHEDFIVQEAMGPIVDRSREYLSSSDRVIIHTRRQLLRHARAHAAGAPAWGLGPQAPASLARIRAGSAYLKPGQDWREIDTHAAVEPQPASAEALAPHGETTTT